MELEEIDFLRKRKSVYENYNFSGKDLEVIKEIYNNLVDNIPYRFRKFFVNLNFEEFEQFVYKLKSNSI